MQVALRLIDDGLHNFGMRVAGGIDGDPGGTVQEVVAVDVHDHCAFSTSHYERIVARVRRRHRFLVARDQRRGLRAGQ